MVHRHRHDRAVTRARDTGRRGNVHHDREGRRAPFAVRARLRRVPDPRGGAASSFHRDDPKPGPRIVPPHKPRTPHAECANGYRAHLNRAFQRVEIAGRQSRSPLVKRPADRDMSICQRVRRHPDMPRGFAEVTLAVQRSRTRLGVSLFAGNRMCGLGIRGQRARDRHGSLRRSSRERHGAGDRGHPARTVSPTKRKVMRRRAGTARPRRSRAHARRRLTSSWGRRFAFVPRTRRGGEGFHRCRRRGRRS